MSTGFLDEVFGGVVRDGTLTESEFWSRVEVIANRDPLLLGEIRSYVNRAAMQAAAH